MKNNRKPYRAARKKPIWKTKLFWRSVIAFLFLGEIAYSVYFLIPFQIKEISISGNEKIGTEAIKAVIDDKIVQKAFFLQSKSIFLVNSAAIEKAVLTVFPQIEKVILGRRFFDGLAAEIRERKPVATFRNSQDFLIDREGIVFEPALGANSLLRISRNGQANLELKLGDRVLDKKLMAAILDIEETLENEMKIPLSEVLIDSEEKLVVKTSAGWEIYFNAQKDLNWQSAKLKALLEKEIPENRRSDLDYVEVRFGNLAPYKYK